LAAARSLAEAFDGVIIDLPEDWVGSSILLDEPLAVSEPDSFSEPDFSNDVTAETLEVDFEQMEPLQLVMEQQSCTSKSSGAWVSLNDLRCWYVQVHRDSCGRDLYTLNRIVELGNLFKDQFGAQYPDKKNWFSSWSDEFFELWIVYYQSTQIT